ncbi:MAG: histidine kinase, partial [Planctomycetota bacterium]
MPRETSRESSTTVWHAGTMPELMPHRVQEILLVSTPYDAYTIEEDMLLGELIYFEYAQLGLSHAPRVTHVASGEEALEAVRNRSFDLVISMLRLGDMDVFRFSERFKETAPGVPLVLLIANELELVRLGDRRKDLTVDYIYVWKGDARLFLAIIKVIEDAWNVEHDTEVGGVGVIILIEDSVRYRSSLLPMVYAELVNQTRAVMLDGLNRMQRLMRMRARPKMLVAETYEGGIELYERYRNYLFGIITDVSFSHNGRNEAQAGVKFISHVHAEQPDVPALLQSSDIANREFAELIGVSFLHKRSRTLLEDLRQFMVESFGFGDFVFRLPDKREVGRARDMRSMPRVLAEVPAASIEYHAANNHFSNWLLARSEFRLAHRLRPRKVSEFKDGEALRTYLIEAFNDALSENRRGTIEDFSRETYDASTQFARIGDGSLGGKSRGLAFTNALLARRWNAGEFEDVRVYVPRLVVLATGVFDEFLALNHLRTRTLYEASDEWIRRVFLNARLPEGVRDDLRAFLRVVRTPIAVRSSSLLEDSQYHPFAGVYDTHMIPNTHPDEEQRLRRLCDAVKLVFASTFFSTARSYIEATAHRIEEEKMAVVCQELVGARHEHYFYPDFAGVVRSYNFYPFGRMSPEDGVADVGLGLGQIVVEGGEALRFCPAHPQVLPQLDNEKQFLKEAQRRFYAIDLDADAHPADPDDSAIVTLGLDDAERHGTLNLLGSVWSHENRTFYDGIHRPGARVVTFAHILKNEVFPLAKILQRLLDLGRAAMSGPVEIEFAVNLQSRPREFAVLQMRPYGAQSDDQIVDLEKVPP